MADYTTGRQGDMRSAVRSSRSFARLGCFALVALLAAAGCREARQLDQRATTDSLAVQGGGPLSVVALQFEPTSEERALIENGLRELAARPDAPDLRYLGRQRPPWLGKFPDSQQRYLLLAYLHLYESPAGRKGGWSLYVLYSEGGVLRASDPLDHKDAEYLEIVRLGDVDGDSIGDVVYCSGYEGDDTANILRTVGFKSGSWYTIEPTAGARQEC